MFTKNYIHRNSACPQRASPEWPRDQCVGTMLNRIGVGGVQALWSGWWDRPGVSHGAIVGLHQGAGNPSPHRGRRSQEAGTGRGGLGAWSTVARGPLEPLIPVLESGQTHPQGAGFRYAPARTPNRGRPRVKCRPV